MNTEAFEKRTVLYYAKQDGPVLRPYLTRDDETALRAALVSEGYELNGPLFQVWEHDDDSGQRLEWSRHDLVQPAGSPRVAYYSTGEPLQRQFLDTRLGYVYAAGSVPAELTTSTTLLFGARIIGFGAFLSTDLHQVEAWQPQGSAEIPLLGCPRVAVPERQVTRIWTKWTAEAPHQTVEVFSYSPESGWGEDLHVPFGVGELIEFRCNRQLEFKPHLNDAIQIFLNGTAVPLGPLGDRTSPFAEGPGCNDGRIVLVNNNRNETGANVEYNFQVTISNRVDTGPNKHWYTLDPKIVNRFKTF